MSRPPERLARGLFAFALTALIAWALALPALGALRVPQEGLAALLYALGASALISLYGLLPRRLRLLVPLLVPAAFGLALAFADASPPARLAYFIRSLLSGAPGRTAVILYLDALLPLVMVLLSLFARLLLEGDPAFTLPLLVAPPVMMWLLGARGDLRLYFPIALCLPLSHVYLSHRGEEEGSLKPPRSLLPRALALALALALLGSVLTPRQPRTQPMMARMAEEIRRRVEDLFFFTATRSVFSLRLEGYQPMGDSGLGGPPDISNQAVMNVQTDQRIYLRGAILDTYTGRAWYDSLSARRHAWNSLRYQGLKADLFNEALPRGERVTGQKARVTMMTGLPSTLFVPQRLKELNPGPDMVPYFNLSSELFITRDLENGDSYAFTYEPYVAGDAGTDALARRLMQDAALQLPNLPEEYLKLPPHLQEDGIVAELAREVTSNAASAYEQALLLMRHLKSNYAYSLEVPWAPETQDFAAHFLFDLKAGYCTYFATAMTVLARSIGLPARYVEGFLARPQEGPSLTLTGQDAHAWTEIYFAGLGWVVFDATAARGDQQGDSGGQQPPDSPPSPEPSPSPSPEPSQEPSPEPGQAATPTPPPPRPEDSPEPSPRPQPGQDLNSPQGPDRPFPWWLLLLLAVLGLLIWRVRAERPQRKAGRMRDSAGALALYWQESLRALRAKGQGILPQETPLAYAMRADAENEGLQQLALARSAQVYGRARPDTDQVTQAARVYEALWAQLPPYKKAALALARAAAPLPGAFKGLPGLAKSALRKAAARLRDAIKARFRKK